MDPASVLVEAYKVGGILLVLVIGFGVLLYAVWKASAARETRMAAALEAESTACKTREAALNLRLTQVETKHIAGLELAAAQSLELGVRCAVALENSTRITERALARFDRMA